MTLEDESVDNWYGENTDAEDIELMNLILDATAFQLIEDEIVDESVQLGNDFGDYYWNGARMVPKPGMCESFND